MKHWLALLGALGVWAGHFFLLYAFASVFPGQPLARVLTALATLVALAANGSIFWIAARRGGRDSFDRWAGRIACAGALLSGVAVLWQGLPALIG